MLFVGPRFQSSLACFPCIMTLWFQCWAVPRLFSCLSWYWSLIHDILSIYKASRNARFSGIPGCKAAKWAFPERMSSCHHHFLGNLRRTTSEIDGSLKAAKLRVEFRAWVSAFSMPTFFGEVLILASKCLILLNITVITGLGIFYLPRCYRYCICYRSFDFYDVSPMRLKGLLLLPTGEVDFNNESN